MKETIVRETEEAIGNTFEALEKAFALQNEKVAIQNEKTERNITEIVEPKRFLCLVTEDKEMSYLSHTDNDNCHQLYFDPDRGCMN